MTRKTSAVVPLVIQFLVPLRQVVVALVLGGGALAGGVGAGFGLAQGKAADYFAGREARQVLLLLLLAAVFLQAPAYQRVIGRS